MENTTAYGISLDTVYQHTIVTLLNELDKTENDSILKKGLSATVLIMTYSLVEARIWSSIKRLTNSDKDLNETKLNFLSNNRNWLFENRKQYIKDEYNITIDNLVEYRAVTHLGNLRNVVAHGGSINVERLNYDQNFKFSKDSFRKALLYYNASFQSYFSGKSIIDDSTVEVIAGQFLTLDFVKFYFHKIEQFLSALEIVVTEKISALISPSNSENATNR